MSDKTSIDGEDLEWISEPEKRATVFTTEFCHVFGGCAECKGIASAGQLRFASKPGFIPDNIPDDQAVFAFTGATKTIKSSDRSP
jgi:hypothetical protein